MRDAIAKRVEETSLRYVADEIGMSWSGLRTFLGGRSPQRRTLEKIMKWYYSRSKRPLASPRDDVETAIALLLNHFRDPSKPRSVRERHRREVIDRLNDGTK